MSRSKRILFITPYPKNTAGSQRFRFEQYLPALQQAGFELSAQSFIDDSTWSILYKQGHAIQKAWGIVKGYLRRVWLLTKLHRFDFVFLHREAAPLGFPIFEWLIAKVLKRKLIYDFDDAIWLPNTSSENRLIGWLKFPQKVKMIISWSYKISAGNAYLMDFAKSYNPAVYYNPTTIDTGERHIPANAKSNRITIGWTGTHSTLKYLEMLRRPLEQLAQSHTFDFVLIADKSPQQPFPNQTFVAWNEASEIDDLNQIDIGVMPLEDDQWSRGKCGFKALQFMALEKPVLVSPVGVNKEIVEPGVNGFYCLSSEDWLNHLKELVKDQSLRKQLGKKGREKVVAEFSVQSNKENYLSLFE